MNNSSEIKNDMPMYETKLCGNSILTDMRANVNHASMFDSMVFIFPPSGDGVSLL
jgi:hypothetical protein